MKRLQTVTVCQLPERMNITYLIKKAKEKAHQLKFGPESEMK